MPRVKSNVARLKRKNKVMKLAKGYWGGRSKLWKAAKEATERAAKYAYRDRRAKKIEFRLICPDDDSICIYTMESTRTILKEIQQF